MRRNRDEAGRCRPFTAHRMALGRLVRPRKRRLATDLVLRDKVQGWLNQRWSPEQIAHSLLGEFPDNPARHPVPESIYQAIYATDGPLGRDQFTCLRTKRRRRRPHRHPDARRAGGLCDMTMISDRPTEVEDRAIAGHWESQWCCQAA